MNRKIVTMAIAAAMTAPTAFAESDNATIYGLINMSLDSISNGNGPTAATQGTRVTKVSSDASRIGFKGMEDIGEGLSAIWQIESLVYVDNSTTNTSMFATRNSYAGLKGSMGTVLLGRYDTPYKIATRKLDVFGEVLADNRTLMGGVSGKSAKLQFDGRQGDVIDYMSPEVGGFSAAAAYVAGAEAATLSGDSKGSALSLAGMYKKDELYATLGYETHNFGSTGTGTLQGWEAGAFAAAGSRESAWKLGLGYTLDAMALGFVYEKTNDNLGGTAAAAPVATCTTVGQDCYGHNAWYLSGKCSFGADAVKLAYSKAGDLAGAAAGTDTSAKQFSIGYDHSLGKRTTLYALYTGLSNGSGINYGLASATVTSGNTAAAGNGATLSAVSFGLKHTF